ncbi:MAG TPA: hypothetical protein VNJ54_14415 [Plantibacter sp.]|nr:hypothetical protein [Plantibacter sp.]
MPPALIAICLTALLAVATFITWTVVTTQPSEWFAVPGIFVVCGGVGALILTPQHLRISEDEALLRALFFVRVTLARRDLNVEVLDDRSTLMYGGWGIRFLPGGMLGFVSGRKPALRFTTADHRQYLFTTSRAIELQDRLGKRNG